MVINYDVKSTAKEIPKLEINVNDKGAVDTVYIRADITINEDSENKEFNIGKEIQYTGAEFIELLTNKNKELEEEVADVWFDSFTKSSQLEDNEEEIAEIWFTIIGGEV